MITYETILPGKAVVQEVFEFVKKSDQHFKPALSTRVDLLEHTQKLVNNATLFIAKDLGVIVGLHATYFNPKPEMSFATFAFVEDTYQGEQMVGVNLIMNSLNYCKNNNSAGYWGTFRKSNKSLTKFYERLGFVMEEDGYYAGSDEVKIRCTKKF